MPCTQRNGSIRLADMSVQDLDSFMLMVEGCMREATARLEGQELEMAALRQENARLKDMLGQV
jgi:hypothetical protein